MNNLDALRNDILQIQTLTYQLEMLQELALESEADRRYKISDYASLIAMLIIPLHQVAERAEQRLFCHA